MRTEIKEVYSVNECSDTLEAAAKIIKSGGLVAFPTETVYGLGANGLDEKACAGIYEAKGRPSDNPLILHISDRSMLDMVAEEIPEMAEKLLAAFCPGPITLIMKRAKNVPLRITGGLDTVGVRMPDNAVARGFIKRAGVPIAAPSANISGRPSPTTAEGVFKDMDGRIPLILDGGPCRFGVESTIVDCTGPVAVVLRPGAITLEMIKEVLGSVKLDPALVGANTVPKAPGMKYRHYAPKAPLTLIEGAPEKLLPAFRREIRRLLKEGHTPGIIASREVCEGLKDLLPEEHLHVYGAQGDLPAIAADIYEALLGFNELPVDSLLAEGTTEKGLGLAIMNRLRKASGFHSIQAGE